MSTYGLVVQKKEMTRMWVNDKFASVTLLTIPTQEIVRYKTEEKDGYVAAVVGVGKKETGKVKGAKIAYKKCAEFPVDANFIQQYAAGAALTSAALEGVEKVTLIGEGKGKGFQGVMKRHNAHG